MTIEGLIEKRKQLGISRREISKLTGYSYPWLCQIEKQGERRFSKEFISKYNKVLNKYKRMIGA